MGEAFGDVDVSRVIYLLLYLFLVIGGLGAMPMARRKAKPLTCPACNASVDRGTAERGPWGGGVCQACGADIGPVAQPPARTGLRGWMDNHPWAVAGAVWALIIWGLLFARDGWIGEPAPGWETLPLTVLGGLGVGWLLQRMHRRS